MLSHQICYEQWQALQAWSHREVRNVVWYLWVKHVSPIVIHHLLIEVYGDDETGVWRVRKWCREFENG